VLPVRMTTSDCRKLGKHTTEIVQGWARAPIVTAKLYPGFNALKVVESNQPRTNCAPLTANITHMDKIPCQEVVAKRLTFAYWK
jgi:hypothetical protein